MDFSGRNFIVTGGARGIGRAAAERIISGGGCTAIIDIDAETGAETARAAGASFYCADLADGARVRVVIAEITKQFGQVHGLINNAGIVSSTPFESLTQQEWDRVIAVNLTSQFITCSALFSHMKLHGYGRIVNVSSVAGKRGGAFLGKSAYAASKAGIIGLTKSIAIEGGPFGITCNAICPAAVDTAMTQRGGTGRNNSEKDVKKPPIPLGRRASPDEIAGAIAFLASDDAAFITGEVMVADGGLTMCG